VAPTATPPPLESRRPLPVADAPTLNRRDDRSLGRSPIDVAKPIRVLVVDDHAIVRCGVRSALDRDREIAIVGEAEDGQDAVHQADELRPDVILMDLRMPRLDGIAATARIRAEIKTCEVVALTAMVEPSWVVSAVRAGAVGYLGKNVGDAELSRAIRQASAGQVYLTPLAASMLMREMRSLEVPDTLSDREMAVLTLVARGLTNQQIAESLRIGGRTVRAHVAHIILKLGVASRGDLAVRAVHLGLLPAKVAALAG
jgi:two-component system, NarL family, response regulator LiaR